MGTEGLPVKKILKLMQKPVPPCTAIVVAAGSSQRMGGVDKLTADLAGAPLVLWSLRAMEASQTVDSVILVVQPGRLAEFAALTAGAGLTKLRQVVAGGETRTDSVRAGMAALSRGCRLVAIHDAARPLVTPQLIDAAVRAAARDGAAAPGLPVKDTIHRTEGDVAAEALDRAALTAIQTPQCFDRDLFAGALRKAVRDGLTLTDDCAAMEHLGMRVRVTPGDERNLKVTTPLDLALVRLLAEEAAP